jgi:HEPN domain-containing protein
LLTRHQIEFTKTHSIGELLRLAERVASGISALHDAARDLTRYAAVDRYPGSDEAVGQASAREHIHIARAVMGTVNSELRSYLEPGRPAS